MSLLFFAATVVLGLSLFPIVRRFARGLRASERSAIKLDFVDLDNGSIRLIDARELPPALAWSKAVSRFVTLRQKQLQPMPATLWVFSREMLRKMASSRSPRIVTTALPGGWRAHLREYLFVPPGLLDAKGLAALEVHFQVVHELHVFGVDGRRLTIDELLAGPRAKCGELPPLPASILEPFDPKVSRDNDSTITGALTRRLPGGSVVVDLRRAPIEELVSLSAFNSIKQEIEELAPTTLVCWMVPGAAIDAWNQKGNLPEVIQTWIESGGCVGKSTTVICGPASDVSGLTAVLQLMGHELFQTDIDAPAPILEVRRPIEIT